MSAPADERWRGGRSYDPNRQPSQRHSNRNVNSRGGQNANTPNNNNNNNNSSWADSQLTTGLSQEQHVPVAGFNAAEARMALKKGPGASKPFFYKLQGKDANSRAGGPWGSKANAMANGKDFFLELRKQVTALQQGGPVAGG